MLSRTASHLYWMARYMERAENAARLVGGIYRLTLISHSGRGGDDEWQGLFQTDGEREAFLKRHETFGTEAVLTYLVLDQENPSSIRSCIWAARENVRATRHVLTTDLWESVNQTWLEIRDKDFRALSDSGIHEFLEWVKERCHLFRGIVYGTMRRGEAFQFWELGTYVERAENTSRLMLARAPFFHTARQRDSAVHYYQWGTLLRSVNSFKTYREIYRGTIEPRCVAELLILNPDMPRSLRACADGIAQILGNLKADAPSTGMAGSLLSELMNERIDRIFRSGIDGFLGDFRSSVNRLSDQLQMDFLMIR